jgi:hypothetical protein
MKKFKMEKNRFFRLIYKIRKDIIIGVIHVLSLKNNLNNMYNFKQKKFEKDLSTAQKYEKWLGNMFNGKKVYNKNR